MKLTFIPDAETGKCPKIDCKYKAICCANIPNELCYEKGDLELNKIILDAKQKG